MQKPSIPAGTRDFSPREMAERNYIFSTIRNVFTLYGFAQIETPAMENLDTLLGKYGEEGDKLLFRILNSGDFMAKIPHSDISAGNAGKLSSKISEKGLRYDLTVPFARYVVQHLNDISFPFKRFQIQPVWRADRPQKGRYREFYQCDADIIGSNSLLNELELVQMINDVFNRLKIDIILKLNNRKILQGIAEYIGHPEKLILITTTIDKLDKAGKNKVVEELQAKGIERNAIDRLLQLFQIDGRNQEKLIQLGKIISSDTGKNGIKEIESILDFAEKTHITMNLEFDLSLARGLNYYTGTIFEVKAKDVIIGSICGGGRYDNLTGIFGLKDVSGVGISFGADRIYDVIKECNLFPESVSESIQVLFINFGESEQVHCLKYLSQLRRKEIRAELYPDSTKLKKQMNYANNKNIPYVVLLGEEEIKQNKLLLKDMKSGNQRLVTINELIAVFI